MPNLPTAAGVFVPGFLNTCNSTSPSGQGDAYGNTYPSGLTPGKVVMLGTQEAQSLAAPTTTLFDGCYQWVLLDSGATAANALAGMAAYFRLDSGATVGSIPETDYDNLSVTTSDQVTNETAASLGAGVFINPATVQGVATAPTPGNWCFIFVGGGRVKVNITTATGTSVGNSVNFNGATSNAFVTTNDNAILTTTLGSAVTTPSTANGAVVYCPNVRIRVGNQGV
jgi:hypothetical protein